MNFLFADPEDFFRTYATVEMAISQDGVQSAQKLVTGYQGVEKRPESAEASVTWHVAERPSKVKKLAGTALGDLVAQVEYAKARIRAKVEHPFHMVKNILKHRKTRYKGLAKNTAQCFTLFGLANLTLARRWLLATDSQVASCL